MKKILSLLFFAVLTVNLWSAPRLFFISRNLNRNIIVYDLRMKGGMPDAKEPMHVYWYNQEHNPVTTNELSFIQRKMAYGYSVVSATNDEIVVKMKALSKRTVSIRKHKGEWIAVTKINGVECQLTEIYAHCPSKTSCDYIEVKGRSLQNGAPQKEKIQS